MKKIYSILALGSAFAWNINDANAINTAVGIFSRKGGDAVVASKHININENVFDSSGRVDADEGVVERVDAGVGVVKVQFPVELIAALAVCLNQRELDVLENRREGDLYIPAKITHVLGVLKKHHTKVGLSETVEFLNKNFFREFPPDMFVLHPRNLEYLLKGEYRQDDMERNLQILRRLYGIGPSVTINVFGPKGEGSERDIIDVIDFGYMVFQNASSLAAIPMPQNNNGLPPPSTKDAIATIQKKQGADGAKNQGAYLDELRKKLSDGIKLRKTANSKLYLSNDQKPVAETKDVKKSAVDSQKSTTTTKDVEKQVTKRDNARVIKKEEEINSQNQQPKGKLTLEEALRQELAKRRARLAPEEDSDDSDYDEEEWD